MVILILQGYFSLARSKAQKNKLISAFSKRALHSNVPSNLVPGTFLKLFRGGKGLSLARSLCTPWEALRNKNPRRQTCLWGWYQVRFFGLIFGHSWGNGEGPGAPGTVPLRNPTGTSRQACLENPDY